MGGETYIAFKQGLIANDGTITDDITRGFLNGFLDQFAALVARFATPSRAAA
jgi:chromate reductase